jgi:hypothetical protein
VAGTALAASSKSSAKATKATKVSCSVSTSIAVAKGQSDVLPPMAQGDEYGPAKCGSLLGAGVQKDSFTVPTSGDTVAKYVMYFNTGTIHGTYDLTPQSSSLNFLATSWTGTLKVLGGIGAYKGVTGTGKMKCGSPDGVHTSCTDKLKLKKLTAG